MTRDPTLVGLQPVLEVPEGALDGLDLDALAKGGKFMRCHDCGCMDEPVEREHRGHPKPMPPRSDFTDNCRFIRHYCPRHWMKRTRYPYEMTNAQWRERARWIRGAVSAALSNISTADLYEDQWRLRRDCADAWEREHRGQA